MSTLGNTSTTFTNWVFDDGNASHNQNGSQFTMPENGVITSISVCCAADVGQGACNAQLVVWNATTGAVIVASSVFSMAAKSSRSTSGWTFTTQSVTPTFVASGTSIVIGYYRVPAGSTLFPTNTGSGSYKGNGTSNSSPASLSGATSGWGGANGNMGAYITYSPTVAWVWNGSSWVAGEVDVYTGSWTPANGDEVYDGTQWNQGT